VQRPLGDHHRRWSQHYSTVAQAEMREGIAKIISLAGVREVMAGQARAGGMEVVWIGDRNENGRSGSAS
jgi:hypothetical protein